MPRVLPFEPRQFSVRGCRTFTACAVRHLLFLNSLIFTARLSIRGRVSVFAAFSAPCSGEFHIFLRPRSPSICRLVLVNLGMNRCLSDRHFFVCLLHLELAGSVSAFLLIESSLRCSGGSGTRCLVRGFHRRPSSYRPVKSFPYLLHCLWEVLFFFVGVLVCPIAG